VVAIHRGAYRAFQSLVIRVEGDDAPDAQQPFPALAACAGKPPEQLEPLALRELLLQSGLWTALRRRPYSKVPAADAAADALFITAIDTRPHAPDVNVVLAGRHDDFAAGVQALARLLSGPTYLCTGADFQAPIPTGPTLRHEVFAGPHPAGNVGTHIHLLHPVDHERCVWHIGYQDVLAVGHLLRTGQAGQPRVVALAGPGVQRPACCACRWARASMRWPPANCSRA
jgi:Na+-transporting NADH:ubiquinone oxidoreductase subunit A